MRTDQRSGAASAVRRFVWRRRQTTFGQKTSTVNASSEDIEMPNPAPGFVSRPDYRVDLVPESRRVKVVFGDVTIAESSAALRCEETGHGPVHYLPEKDALPICCARRIITPAVRTRAKPPTGR